MELHTRPYPDSVCDVVGHAVVTCGPSATGDDYAEVREPDRQVLGQAISPREVLLEERIGEGQFGDVHKGTLYPAVSGGRGFTFPWHLFVYPLPFPFGWGVGLK